MVVVIAVTAKLVRVPELEHTARKLERVGAYQGGTKAMGKLPYCIQEYVPPYQGLRYVADCRFAENGDIAQNCFASPAPYGVLGDPVELFNCAPNEEVARVDPLLELEFKDIMLRIAKHLHERTGKPIARLAAEFILDRFGKVYLQTVCDYEWRRSGDTSSSGPGVAMSATPSSPMPPREPNTSTARPLSARNTARLRWQCNEDCDAEGTSRKPRPPSGRPSTARQARQGFGSVKLHTAKTRARPQTAGPTRSIVARECRNPEVTSISKALSETRDQVRSLKKEMEASQEEAGELRQEIRNKELDANMLRMEMKREWEQAIDSRQGGAKGTVNERVEELRQLVKHQQQNFGVSLSRSMLMFRDELLRLHQEFDRRDRDNLDRIKMLEGTVTDLTGAIKTSGLNTQRMVSSRDALKMFK